MLLIATVLPVAGTLNIDQNKSILIKNESSIESMDEDWWPMYNHDPLNSGFSTSNAPNNGTLRWIFKANYTVSSPVVDEGMVYVGSNHGFLYCLDMDTGWKIWEYEIGHTISGRISPAVYNGKVYVTSLGGVVYCLNAETGSRIWRYWIGRWIYSSPVVVDDKVYVGADDGKLYCLDAETGSKIWHYVTTGWMWTSPAVADGKVYFGTYGKKVYCLNAETGDKIWDVTLNDKIEHSSPSVANGKIYIGSADGNIYCLNAETGLEIWKFLTNGKILSSPAVAYGNVYFGSEDGNAYCLNAETGDKIWIYEADSKIQSSPSLADNKVYIGSRDSGSEIYCLNAYTGDKIWNYSASAWSNPAIADGKLFFGCYDLLCFEDGPYYPPNVTEIYGPTHGKPGEVYDYTFVSTEPNGDDVYYYIRWGDGTPEEWIGPYSSGAEVTLSHAFPNLKTYYIYAKAKDVYNLESDWGILKVTMPRTRATYNSLFLRFLEQFPILKILLLR
jgi:outer membrane protein assembly factor BamB